MKSTTGPALLGALLSALSVEALPTLEARDVDTRFPYTGPAVPVGDWVDPTINGNGKGFPRLVEPPAVKPAKAKPSNNVNVISLSYVPHGVNIHYQTPFGLGVAPTVHYGTHPNDLCNKVTGHSTTYVATGKTVIFASMILIISTTDTIVHLHVPKSLSRNAASFSTMFRSRI